MPVSEIIGDESVLKGSSGTFKKKWDCIKEQHIIAVSFSPKDKDAVQSHSREQKIVSEEEVKNAFQLLVTGQKAGKTACLMFHISAHDGP